MIEASSGPVEPPTPTLAPAPLIERRTCGLQTRRRCPHPAEALSC